MPRNPAAQSSPRESPASIPHPSPSPREGREPELRRDTSANHSGRFCPSALSSGPNPRAIASGAARVSARIRGVSSRARSASPAQCVAGSSRHTQPKSRATCATAGAPARRACTLVSARTPRAATAGAPRNFASTRAVSPCSARHRARTQPATNLPGSAGPPPNGSDGRPPKAAPAPLCRAPPGPRTPSGAWPGLRRVAGKRAGSSAGSFSGWRDEGNSPQNII
jgi:hypothetical protein